ncbi:hypothetical protein HYPSUDRAFT_60038 [Hypholoma sublateritium FD-334 SS-4]|uniref:Uncharacterized protein n=1 Tax=Hypholoma sublateritium (strain FD-334 SS-4) TaxID=945553 RepID=A0A0D2KFN7_HYPSF|nr:hypothetical protein HYPSUDRAFT_60038 [Hypholoma sublateritium FD-334 SS-4]
MLQDDMLDGSAAEISKSKEDLRQASLALATAYHARSRILLDSAAISIKDARIALGEYESAWKNLLEDTSGERPDGIPGQNHYLQHIFRGWMYFFLSLLLLAIGCIAVKAFHDLVMERAEMGRRNNSHMGLLAYH